jgi:hypothetical protein
MAELSFDDLIPKKNGDKAQKLPPITVEFDDLIPKKEAKKETKPDDHGLSERQKRTQVEKALTPITDYWSHYQELNRESRDLAMRGASEFGEAVSRARPGSLAGLADAAMGAGKAALGGVGWLSSPLSAIYRSVIGQPIEDVTGIPREQTEFLAQLATPGIGFTRLARPPGVAAPAPLIRPPEAPPRPMVAEATQRLNEMGIPVDVPRAIEGGINAQRAGQGLSNVPFVGNPLTRAVHETLPQQLEAARNAVAAEFGTNVTGPNAASRARGTLEEAASAETRAANEAAALRDRRATAEWEAANAAREQGIADRQAQSLQATEARTGNVNPQDAGAATIEAVRAADQAAEAAKNRLYDVAGAAEGTIRADAVTGVRARAAQDLENAGRAVDPELTPAANRMLRELEDFERLQIPNKAVGARVPATGDTEIAGVSLQGAERIRKRLNSFSQNAKTPEDARAARQIKDSFDDWQNDAMQNALMSGDPQSLEKFQRARAANRDWRERFGYNERNDADRMVQKIIQQDVTPQEVSQWLIGSGKVGKQGTTSRLFQHVMDATGNSPELHQAIRGSVWNTLSESANAAKDIREFIGRSGRDLAGRLFSREDQALMLAHARELDAAKAARETATQTAKSTKPQPTEVTKGPMQTLADQVIGRGQKSDEALFNTLHGYATSGARADVKKLADVMRNLPEELKGDLAGSFIRNLGISKRTGNFSPDQFVSQWNTLSPQAKSVMFGNAGPHVTALDDIATIAQRLKDVQGRFGNRSGTAQNSIFAALAGLAGYSPATAAKTAALGGIGWGAAHFLASPAGASSMAKYARAVERASRTPSPEHLAAVQRLERNLANTARTLSASHQ